MGSVVTAGSRPTATYVSPRTKFRVPAIEAWRAHHTEVFGQPVIDVPDGDVGRALPERRPGPVPRRGRCARAAVSPRSPASAPSRATAPTSGLLKPSNLQRFFDEDIRGTAIDHLGGGLFEAHGRDEAGWEEEAGHKDMWFAARDVAFESQLGRRRHRGDARAAWASASGGRDGGDVQRLLPGDIDAELEFTVALMIRVLFIEVSAFHTFRWAEAWLSDPDLVAGEGAAGRLVSYIRADETPARRLSRHRPHRAS